MRNLATCLALFYCRKELLFLSVMFIAIPISLICRGCANYSLYSGEQHQQKAIQLFNSGADLISIQLDPILIETQEYCNQIKLIKNPPVLASRKGYNNIYGRRYYHGSIYEIIDVKLQHFGNLPVPNVIEREITVDNDVAYRLFYVFQGENALNETNTFLKKYAESELPPPNDDFMFPDSTTGIVDDRWVTRFKTNSDSSIMVKMWFGKQWLLSSNNSNSTYYESGSYMLSYYNHCDYIHPIIDSNLKIRKIEN